jgi:outer membrane protein
MKTTILVATSLLLSGLATAAWAQAGDFEVRVGLAGVLPLDSSSHVDIIGGSVRANDSISPEIDLSYYVTNNLAVQVIAASTRHDISVANSALGAKLDLGSTWVLPPTIVAQYHFLPNAAFSPYVGAGVNVTFFYAENAATPPIDKLSLSNTIGGALEAGADLHIQGPWYLNVDYKQLFLTTDARVHALGLLIKGSDALNPGVISAGIAYRF